MVTETHRFRVKSFMESEVGLKMMDGPLFVFVVYEERVYSSSLWRDLSQLSVGDVVTLELESQNQANDVWHISEIVNWHS